MNGLWIYRPWGGDRVHAEILRQARENMTGKAKLLFPAEHADYRITPIPENCAGCEAVWRKDLLSRKNADR